MVSVRDSKGGCGEGEAKVSLTGRSTDTVGICGSVHSRAKMF